MDEIICIPSEKNPDDCLMKIGTCTGLQRFMKAGKVDADPK